MISFDDKLDLRYVFQNQRSSWCQGPLGKLATIPFQCFGAMPVIHPDKDQHQDFYAAVSPGKARTNYLNFCRRYMKIISMTCITNDAQLLTDACLALICQTLAEDTVARQWLRTMAKSTGSDLVEQTPHIVHSVAIHVVTTIYTDNRPIDWQQAETLHPMLVTAIDRAMKKYFVEIPLTVYGSVAHYRQVAKSIPFATVDLQLVTPYVQEINWSFH